MISRTTITVATSTTAWAFLGSSPIKNSMSKVIIAVAYGENLNDRNGSRMADGVENGRWSWSVNRLQHATSVPFSAVGARKIVHLSDYPKLKVAGATATPFLSLLKSWTPMGFLHQLSSFASYAGPKGSLSRRLRLAATEEKTSQNEKPS